MLSVSSGTVLHHNRSCPLSKQTDTKKTGDAYEIAKSLPLGEFDALLSVSGDGLIHEVLNGFANHAYPRKAFQTPVAPIPTGSGNGLSLNLLGIEAWIPYYPVEMSLLT